MQWIPVAIHEYAPAMSQADSRVVECARCGAPIGARSQTQVTCRYCGASNSIGARPNDFRQAPSPAEEIARLARLKAQQDHAVPGHVFDLEAFPPALMTAGQQPWIADHLDALERLWPSAKASANAGIEQQRALLWIAAQMVRLLQTAGRDDVAQARMETALDVLSDPGHRLLARTVLARAAVRAGKPDDAAEFLSECDPAPEVLELDSALRYANARVRLARGDAAGTLALVGPEPDAMPWAKAFLGHSSLARIHAYELLDQLDKAKALWRRAIAGSGQAKGSTAPKIPPIPAAALLDLARAEGLAPRTRLEPLKQQARTVRGQINRANSISLVFPGMLVGTPILCFLLSFVAMIEGCSTGDGPLLGSLAPIVCPQVCDDCRPPLTYLFWSSSSGGGKRTSKHAVLCDGVRAQPSTMDWSSRMDYGRKFPHQEVPGGAAMLFAVSFLVLFPFCLIPAAVLSIRKKSRLKRQEPELLQKLAPLEAELQAAGALQGLYDGLHRIDWRVALWLCFAMLFFMGSCTGIGFTACTEPPPSATTD